MRTSKTLTVSMTQEQLAQAQRLAQQENRTMSELIREALRQYQSQRFWDGVDTHRARAEALGIEEQDVAPIIRSWRKEQREKSPRKTSKRPAR